MRFCTFSTFAQNIYKGWGCNFTWSFCKVMRSKSMKMVFVARIIRHKLCMIYEFYCSKIIFDRKIIFILLRWIWLPGVHCILVLFWLKYFLLNKYWYTNKIAPMNINTRGPLYSFLVYSAIFSLASPRGREEGVVHHFVKTWRHST